MEIQNSKLAFLFPGQGSQFIGMGQDLAERFPSVARIFEEADDILGYSITKISWSGPEQDLNDTINTQPALLVHSVAALEVLKNLFPNIRPRFVAGHSMGELSALVAANAINFKEALRLVHERGRVMKLAGTLRPGGMAALLGLDIPTVETICQDATNDDEIVQIANDNCPGQVVISGTDNALTRAIDFARYAGARKVKQLAVSIAAHSPLMAEAQEEFTDIVDDSPIDDPSISIVGNVNAAPLDSAREIRSDLKEQLISRVRWTESIRYMTNQGATTFFELGSGSILKGLLRRIDRNLDCFSLGNSEDFSQLSELST
jgi:[acyl-carrier-protein] S-malonyltransferase